MRLHAKPTRAVGSLFSDVVKAVNNDSVFSVFKADPEFSEPAAGSDNSGSIQEFSAISFIVHFVIGNYRNNILPFVVNVGDPGFEFQEIKNFSRKVSS